MPVTDTWSYDTVPPGTYSFTVRATNAAGTSGSSNSVTLTFPLTSCSTPGTPVSFSFGATGRVAAAYWLAPPSGTTPTRYTVEARLRNPNNSTTALGLFPVTATTISSPVGPGRYEVRVRSENICGNSSFTGWQAVTVQ
jgi:predicted phage tail protein